MFDGRWYIKSDSEKKTFTRQELRYEDEIGDPYSLGEGLFPLPFGQKKADILDVFDVALEGPDAKLDPANTDHLKLTPRTGTRLQRKYNWIDFWISRGGQHDGLPVKVRLAKNEGTGKVSEYITAEFSDIKLNRGISPSVFELSRPNGYQEQVERLPPRDGGPAPAPSRP
jgi:outer membrane lipoprotein-sorting protein